MAAGNKLSWAKRFPTMVVINIATVPSLLQQQPIPSSGVQPCPVDILENVQAAGGNREYPVPANQRRRGDHVRDVLDRRNFCTDEVLAAPICADCFSELSRSWSEPGGQFDLATPFRSHPAEDLWWPVVLGPALFRQPISRPSRGPSATRQSVPGTGHPLPVPAGVVVVGKASFHKEGISVRRATLLGSKGGMVPILATLRVPP
jgi:hypothetical protein